MAVPIAPKGASFKLPLPDFGQANLQAAQSTKREQSDLEEILKINLIQRPGGGGRNVKIKLPINRPSSPPIAASQSRVTTTLMQYIMLSTGVAKSKKNEKKENIKEDVEKALKDAKGMLDNCLKTILMDKTPLEGKYASKKDELMRIRGNYETAYDYLTTEESRVNLSDDLYNVLSQPDFSQGKHDLRSVFFELPPGEFYSDKTPLLNDVVFAFIIHALVHPEQSLRPFQVIKKCMAPLGLPDIENKLKTFDVSDQFLILRQIVTIGTQFPFNSHLPHALGTKGVEVIAYWCQTLVPLEEFDAFSAVLVTIFGDYMQRLLAFGPIQSFEDSDEKKDQEKNEESEGSDQEQFSSL